MIGLMRDRDRFQRVPAGYQPAPLEKQSQAEFHLSRSIGLTGNHAKASGTVDIQRRVGWLKVVQDVQELETQRRSHALSDPDILRHGEVEVKGSESAENAGATTIGIDSQDQSAETRVHRTRIGKHVNARSTAIAGGARGAGGDNIVVGGVSTVIGNQSYCVF